MQKTDFIKVHGKVILAANARFYREQKCQIEEPTEEEIKAEFPEYQIQNAADPIPAPVMEASPAEEEEPAPAPKRIYKRKSANTTNKINFHL